MSSRASRRKCPCCKQFFGPDFRNGYHQRYCSKLACRQASKARSQRRWTRKSSNRDYFRGPEQVRRVQAWRRERPGYWRKSSPASGKAQIAEPQPTKPEQRSCNVPHSDLRTLQDLCLTEHPAFVGLISMVTGSTLQEDIEATTRQVLLRGERILGLRTPMPADYEKASDPTRSPPSGSTGL